MKKHWGRLLLALAVTGLSAGIEAQKKQRREKFPPRSWKAMEEPEAVPAGSTFEPSWISSKSGDALEGMTLTFQMNRKRISCEELVVTTSDGWILTRSPVGQPLKLQPMQVGDQYIVYAARTKDRRYRQLDESLIELPGDAFPCAGWEPMRPARWKLKGLQQKSWEKDLKTDLAKKLREALENGGRKPKKKKKKKKGKPEHALKYSHQVSFDARKLREPALYLLCKVRADGSDEIVHQSLSSPLNAGSEAKKGDSFRIYELYPRSKRFRESDVIKLTIGKE